MSRIKGWSINEINYVLNNHEDMTRQEIADELDRSYASVNAKFAELGIRRKQDLKEYALYSGDDLRAFGTIPEISELTGLTKSTLYSYASRGTNKNITMDRIEDDEYGES